MFFVSYLKVWRAYIITIPVIFGILFYFFLPTTQYKLGNIFFGDVPSMYNTTLAQYFFLTASHPIFGEAPEFANYQLSRTYFIEGRFYESINAAKAEILLYPDNKRTYYILGLTYGYMSREEEAIEAFSQFIEAYPESWAARNDKAWLQFRVGDVEGALETMEPVKDLHNAWVQNTYGTLLLNTQRLLEARGAFKRAETIVNQLNDSDWGAAYPGNDPQIYDIGLSAMKKSISDNLLLIEELEALSPGT